MATILVVDDEPQVLLLIAGALEREGHQVLTAGGGAEAISIWKAWPGGIDLLLSDVDMPEIDGLTLVQALRAMSPELHVILMSGKSPPGRHGAAAFRLPTQAVLHREPGSDHA